MNKKLSFFQQQLFNAALLRLTSTEYGKQTKNQLETIRKSMDNRSNFMVAIDSMSRDFISDTFTTCFEGGSVWVSEYKRTSLALPDGAHRFIGDFIQGGGTVMLKHDADTEAGWGWSLVNAGTIWDGLHRALLSGWDITRLVEDQDAESADVILQFGLFKEIVYG